jgi:hypothetical protein
MSVLVHDMDAANDSWDNINKEIGKILVCNKQIVKKRGRNEIIENFL